jgi:hypothetical protein
VKFRDFAPYVQPECPGLPLFECDRAVREAAIELLSKADLYQAEPEDLRTVPGVEEYELSAPSGAEASRVMDIQFRGQSLRKLASEMEVQSLLARSGSARPQVYYQRDNTSIILAPLPKEAETFRLFLSLKPTSASTALPDGIGKEHRNLIATGAKAWLMLMNAQPWSNPQLGMLNRQLFQRGISAAIRRAQFGNSGAPLTVRKRPFI